MSLFRDCDQDATAEEIKETLKRYEFSSRPAVSFGEFLKMSHDLETDPGLLKEGFFDAIWAKYLSTNDLAGLAAKSR